MNISTRQVVHGFVFTLGIVLIVGGLATGTYGAAIIGLIVAAVNFQQWQQGNQQHAPSNKQ